MGYSGTVYVAAGSGFAETDSLAWPSYSTVIIHRSYRRQHGRNIGGFPRIR
jgi:hypothetical protein